MKTFASICRHIPRKCRRLLLVLAISFMISFILFTISYEIWKEGDLESGRIFSQISDPFGSRNVRYCEAQYYVTVERSFPAKVSDRKQVHSIYSTDQSVCHVREGNNADIQIEDVWDAVSMGYPDLVLTVSGWVDTIKVDSWTVKPLTVIVMPFSHQDPGWLQTVDSYYITSTRHTLDLMVEKLTKNPSWTFIWAEIGLLHKWWSQATSAQKEQFKMLLEKGQLEIVSGGWVMTDESVAHYSAMVDQLIEGHLWVKDNLNVTVKNAWAIDPFGHSSTMSYILKQSGITNMVIQRSHFAIKRLFAKDRKLEFYWRQSWDNDGRTDIFCHMMPFMLYGIPFSCGPDRHVCCKFDFSEKHCFYGKERVGQITVTEENVAELARELWEQLQKKSEMFRSKVVLMPHGDDFRFKTSDEWKNQLENLQKMMKFINNNPEFKTKIKFGTLKDYFGHVSRESVPQSSYPVLSGDFFPYSDRSDQFWSGFYSSRPHFKFIARQLQHLLRSAEVLFTLTLGYVDIDTNMEDLYRRLDEARKTLALSQHHDAITGTSRQAVMKDYRKRVLAAINDITDVQRQTVASILKLHRNESIIVNLTESFGNTDSYPSKVVCRLETPVNIVVWNDVGYHRREVIHLIVDKPDVEVTDQNTTAIRHQISPHWNNQHITSELYLLSVEVNVDAFSLKTFKISPISVSLQSKFATISKFSTKDKKVPLSNEGRFIIREISDAICFVSNPHIVAEFKACDGMLNSLFYKDSKSFYKVDTHFVTYSTGRNTHPFRDKSGAYIFMPDGVAKDLKEKPYVIVIEGGLFTEVRAIYKDIIHVSTIYNISGIHAEAVHIENYVGIATPNWDNKELVMRIETSVANGNVFYTDTNGYQLHRRKTRSKMSIQGNFYPMTSTAILEGDNSRFTLMTSDSHGVASLVSGWLEVVLDRRLVQDDWRGLNEGVTDNEMTKSSFTLLFEKKLQIKQDREKANTYTNSMSLRSDYLTYTLNSPLKVLFMKSPHSLFRKDHPAVKLASALPCGWHIINLRMFDIQSQVKEALFTFHRVGHECSYLSSNVHCLENKTMRWQDLLPGLNKVTEMSLTGVTAIKESQVSDNIDIGYMQMKTFKLAFR